MSTKLIDLDPCFIIRVDEKSWRKADTASEAQGLWFQCPKCKSAGGHYVLCWFKDRGIADTETPGPGRWTPTGSDFGSLSLEPSVLLSGAGCGWHGYITNGEVSII